MALTFLKATEATPFLLSFPDFEATVLVPFLRMNFTLPVPARPYFAPLTVALPVAFFVFAAYLATVVVFDESLLTVTVPSTGKKYQATVVGYSSTRDVAVLRLQGASGLSTVTPDRTVSVGEAVTAVGNAEGAGTLTAADGTVLVRRTSINVSADDGTTEHLTGLIENSSDVVSGDSGGALFDAQDEVVGMNVAASSGTAQVTGYAIPITRVLRIADKIVAGTVTKSLTIGSRAALGVEIDSSSSTPSVAGVVSGGAADKAGLTVGDTITSIGGTAVSTYSGLTQALAAYRPGEQVKLGWTDAGGAPHSATVALGTAPIG